MYARTLYIMYAHSENIPVYHPSLRVGEAIRMYRYITRHCEPVKQSGFRHTTLKAVAYLAMTVNRTFIPPAKSEIPLPVRYD